MVGGVKVAILLGDGMGDYPVAGLGGRTPLQAAHTPHMRRIAAAGTVRMLQTVPDTLPPGSDVANLALLGYDATENYTGRAPIEAAGAGITLGPDDVAFRCNLVTVRDGVMIDHSSGHITSAEGRRILDTVQEHLGRNDLRFHCGVSYRHLLIWDRGPAGAVTEPPHEMLGQPVKPYLPKGEGEDAVRSLLSASADLLAEHPVNLARREAGKNEATQIWLWGQGRSMRLASYRDRYGLSGGMITAVDLLRGLAVLAGLEVVEVEGATGFVDTNYEGKARAALETLDRHDFVYVHVEAPDECGHQGDAELKTRAISDFDARIVGPVWRGLEEKGEPYRLIVAMDHRTPVAKRGHTREPVPLAVLDGPVGEVTQETAFDESVNNGVSQGMAQPWIASLLRERG